MHTFVLKQDVCDPNSQSADCGLCGSADTDTKWQERSVEILPSASGKISVSFKIPVRYCRECGFEFTDDEAEVIEDNAVRSGYGLLIPDEIVEIRKCRGLNQQELADLTGIGVASIGRWETRAKMQSMAYDNLLRLVKDDVGFSMLVKISKERKQSEQAESGRRERPKFKCIDGGKSIPSLERRRQNFELY